MVARHMRSTEFKAILREAENLISKLISCKENVRIFQKKNRSNLNHYYIQDILIVISKQPFTCTYRQRTGKYTYKYQRQRVYNP